MPNKTLKNAKSARNDEFYTQWTDVEREVQMYIEYNPDVFRNKTILCPCDDPEWSNFTKFFVLHFKDYGIKKLISTSYAPKKRIIEATYSATEFEQNNSRYDESKSINNGKIFILERNENHKENTTNIDQLDWDYLSDDGDFRSKEVTNLRDEADIIITNPPFSLFREFMTWLIEADKQFLIIGSLNAITYKEIFPLIMNNRVWLGNNYRFNGGAMFYEIPECIADLEKVREVRKRDDGKNVYITRVQGIRWFTNIDHGRRHQPLTLMTVEDNMKFSKHSEIRGKTSYEKYDNFDAIDVPFIDAIPSDYNGMMGVPVSLLDKYCLEQFEILGLDRYIAGNRTPNKRFTINDREVYARLVIRNKLA